MSESEDELDWNAIERIFSEARQLPPHERDAFVQEQADGDERVVEQILRLLQNDRDDGFLEPPGDATLLGHLDQAHAPPPDLEGHLLFGQYELGGLIGRGASGAVYVGVDRFTKRPVAAKVLTDKTAASAARYELSSLRLLRLPGVVTLLDDGVDVDLGVCLVMEMIDGQPFGPAMGPMPWSEVRRTTGVLFEILARIHARGMLHKDLKPANVLVDQDGIPTVLDLGISGVPHESQSAQAILIGTPAYMAPEVAGGALPNEASDIYAVGLLALEALTGTKRYLSGHTPTTLVQKQGYSEITLESWLQDEHAPPEAREVLGALLAPDPRDRPRSARLARGLFESDRSSLRHPAVGAGSEKGLRPLFVGHERLFHIPSDAARELWRRTKGDSKAVEAELDAWETARLGHWDKSGFHIEREAIETLRAGFHPRVPAEAPHVPAGTEHLIPFIRVLPAPATQRILAEAAHVEPKPVEAALEELVAVGIVERNEDGTYAPTARALALPLPEHVADYAGRLANAWPQGRAGRLELVINAGRDAEVAAEAIYAARSAFKQASLSECVRVCELGLRTNPPTGTEFALLAVMLRASIPQTSIPAIERALMLVERSRLPESKRRPLEQIARCAIHSLSGRTDRAWAALPDRATYEDDLLHVLDDMVRTFLLRQMPLDLQEQRTRAFFGPPEDARRPAALSAWAWLRLFQNRYEEAGQLFKRQVELAPNASSRVSQLANVLYTRMLLCCMDEAEVTANELRSAAEALRLTRILANVECDLRDIHYAKGGVPPLDPPLIDAVRDLGHGHFTARMLTQEAVYAWRQGKLGLAIENAAEACAPALEHDAAADPVVRAFYAFLAPDAAPDDKASLTAALDDCETPTDVVQVIALMAMRDPTWTLDLLDVFEEALAKIPRHTWHFRREVLSIDEAVKSVRGEPQG